MQRAKLFLIGITILVGFLWLITLFLPSKITVSRWINIDANQSVVAAEIDDFANWKNWYPAFQNQNINIELSQKNDTPSVTLTNENGEKIVMVLSKSSMQNINIRLLGDDRNSKIYRFILLSNNKGQTQITWNVDVELGWYPWKKLGGIFLDKIIGPSCEAALENLKKSAEKDTH